MLAIHEYKELRLDCFGTFFHGEELLANKKIAKLFHEGLCRSEDGKVMIKLGRSKEIVKSDSGFFIFVVSIEDKKDGVFLLCKNGRKLSASDCEFYAHDDGSFSGYLKSENEGFAFSREGISELSPYITENNGAFFLAWRNIPHSKLEMK